MSPYITMMKAYIPMPELKLSGNMQDNWQGFEEAFADYAVL